MNNTEKLILLHSNDLHGDFLAEQVDEKLVGGVSMLSGYISKTRRENENVIYAIAGDMFRGSLIDSEYKGISTIEIMNMLAPDVVTLGNHEVDYGLAHLLFIEKCASFPIINANMYLTTNHKRLFKSNQIIEVGGMKVMFIGILTEETLASIRPDALIGSFVDIREAANEVGRICNSYKTTDIDFTVLLTHIGIEADIELAKILDPEWGVDVIIGGHSHTKLDEPVVVNGIPIVQAAYGTNQIGRFDITVDTDENRIQSYEWQLVEINEQNCPHDPEIEDIILHYKNETDSKYNCILTRFAGVYSHPARNTETELGRIFSDGFREMTGVDIMLTGSGSIRSPQLGTIVTRQDLLSCFPFGDAIHRITVTGAQLRKMVKHILRDDAWRGTTEFYQFSKGFRIVYDKTRREILSLSLDGEDVKDDKLYTVGLQDYHFNNMDEFLNVTLEEVRQNAPTRKLATNCTDVIEEYMSGKELIKLPDDRRLNIIE